MTRGSYPRNEDSKGETNRKEAGDVRCTFKTLEKKMKLSNRASNLDDDNDGMEGKDNVVPGNPLLEDAAKRDRGDGVPEEEKAVKNARFRTIARILLLFWRSAAPRQAVIAIRRSLITLLLLGRRRSTFRSPHFVTGCMT